MKKILTFYLFSTTALSVGAFAGKNQFSGNENEMPISASIAKKSYDFQKDPVTFEDFVQKIGAPEVYGLEDEKNRDNQRITLLKEKIIECHEHKIQDISTLKQQLNLTEEISSLALSLKEESTSAFFCPGLEDLEAHAESRKKYLSFLAQREEQMNTSQGRWDLVFKFLERRVGFSTMGSGNVLRGTGQLDVNQDIDTIPIPYLTINQEAYSKWKEQASINPSTPSFLLWLESQKRNETRDELLLRAWRKNGLPRIQEVYDLLVKHNATVLQPHLKNILAEGKELLKSSEAMDEISKVVQQVDNQIRENENEERDFFRSPFWLSRPLTSWDRFLLDKFSNDDYHLDNAIRNKFPCYGLSIYSEEYKKSEFIKSLSSRWIVARQLEFLGLPMELAIGDENYRLNEEEFMQLKELLSIPYYLTDFGKVNSFYNLPEWFCNKKDLFKIIPKKLPEPKLIGNELIVKDGLLSYADHTISPINGYGLYVLDKQKKFRVMLGRYSDFEQRSLQLVHTDLVKECEPVLAAGIIEIREGKITYLSDESGHYKPRLAHFKQAITFLQDAIAPYATIKHFFVASRAQAQDKLSKSKDPDENTRFLSDFQSFDNTWQKKNNALSFPPSLDYLQSIPGESYEWGTRYRPGSMYGTRSFRFESLRTLTDGKPEEWEPLQKEFANIRTKNILEIKNQARAAYKKRIVESIKKSKAPNNKKENSPITFRTTGENKNAKNKHSAISIKLSNQELQSDAYQLIVNHRTTGKGPVVRVHDPIQGYIPLGTLPSSPSGFCDTSFDLSWVQAIRNDSPLDSVISTYLSFVGGTSDIHSFTIRSSGGKTLKEVIFGDSTSELQPGIHVYGPETDENANEWSKAQWFASL